MSCLVLLYFILHSSVAYTRIIYLISIGTSSSIGSVVNTAHSEWTRKVLLILPSFLLFFFFNAIFPITLLQNSNENHEIRTTACMHTGLQHGFLFPWPTYGVETIGFEKMEKVSRYTCDRLLCCALLMQSHLSLLFSLRWLDDWDLKCNFDGCGFLGTGKVC